MIHKSDRVPSGSASCNNSYIDSQITRKRIAGGSRGKDPAPESIEIASLLLQIVGQQWKFTFVISHTGPVFISKPDPIDSVRMNGFICMSHVLLNSSHTIAVSHIRCPFQQTHQACS
eukprot:1145818_1